MSLIQNIFDNKNLKPKAKVEKLSRLLQNSELSVNDLIDFANKAKDPVKASCIEAFEFATKANPAIATPLLFQFVTETLLEKAPRIKWESAKVIGNIAHLFPDHLDKAIINLLMNTEHIGTVVRWSAAFALGEIVKLKSKSSKKLIPAIHHIIAREEKNSIRKIYMTALKTE